MGCLSFLRSKHGQAFQPALLFSFYIVDPYCHHPQKSLLFIPSTTNRQCVNVNAFRLDLQLEVNYLTGYFHTYLCMVKSDSKFLNDIGLFVNHKKGVVATEEASACSGKERQDTVDHY